LLSRVGDLSEDGDAELMEEGLDGWEPLGGRERRGGVGHRGSVALGGVEGAKETDVGDADDVIFEELSLKVVLLELWLWMSEELGRGWLREYMCWILIDCWWEEELSECGDGLL
jgi:hypothetical protein